MARKKKTDIIESADLAEMAKGDWPQIVKGSHLTVKTFEDGHTELEWDDEQLAKEVREAIDAYELDQLKPAVKAKVASRKKKDLVK